MALVRAAIESGTPLFGVCRGLQEMNVALGGSLHQQLHTEPGLMDHREPEGETIEVQFATRHEVRLTPGSAIRAMGGWISVPVNSLHGQGIKRLGEGLVVEAVAPDGLVEGVRVANAQAFAYGVQWHPEWRHESNPFYAGSLEAFARACAEQGPALSAQDGLGHLGESGAAFGRRDVGRRMRELGFEAADVGHADAVGKVLEHQHVVGRIADIDPAVDLVVQVAAQQLAHYPARARQLVVVAEPAVDVDGAHRGVHALVPHEAHHLCHARRRQLRVFAVVYGDVGLAARAVARQRGARHFANDAPRDLLHAREIGGANLLVLLVELAQRARPA